MPNTYFSSRKLAACLSAPMLAVSMTACGDTSSESGSDKDTTTTTVTASGNTAEEIPAETTGEGAEGGEEAPASETEAGTEAAPAETNLPDDFDAQLDSMIASVEAEIPDITVWSGLGDTSTSDVTLETTSGAVTTTAAPAETTTAAAAVTDTAEVKNEHQFVFDGKLYDNANFVSEGVDVPSGWTVDPDSASGMTYINSSYKYCTIEGAYSKGAAFMINEAKKNNSTALPSLKLYKGLTWGATVDDIKAAYGAPAKESNKEGYGTNLTNLFYSSTDGGLIIYQVSSDWGLIIVNCCGK